MKAFELFQFTILTWFNDTGPKLGPDLIGRQPVWGLIILSSFQLLGHLYLTPFCDDFKHARFASCPVRGWLSFQEATKLLLEKLLKSNLGMSYVMRYVTMSSTIVVPPIERWLFCRGNQPAWATKVAPKLRLCFMFKDLAVRRILFSFTLGLQGKGWKGKATLSTLTENDAWVPNVAKRGTQVLLRRQLFTSEHGEECSFVGAKCSLTNLVFKIWVPTRGSVEQYYETCSCFKMKW